MARGEEQAEDLVRVEQGWWTKDENGVTRFGRMENRIMKGIKLREGDGLSAVKTKLIAELMIDDKKENIELTYEMPEWMDVDGKVKPVPIHIRTDDEMDMFLAMRVEIHELKLYVVPLPKLMTLQMDEYEVVPVMNEHSVWEVMSKKEREQEMLRREGKRRIDELIGKQAMGEEDIQLSQKRPEVGEASRTVSLSWRSDDYLSGKFGSLTDAFRHYQAMAEAYKQTKPSPTTVLSQSESSEGQSAEDVTPLTRDLFKEFEEASGISRKRCGNDVAGENTVDDGNIDAPGRKHNKGGEGEAGARNTDVVHVGETNRRHGKGIAVAEAPNPGTQGFGGMNRETPVLDLPSFVFSRDAAPVVDDDGVENTMLSVEYEGDELFVGRVFKSKEDCRTKIAVHAINRRFSYRKERTNNDYVIVRCLSDSCPWRVYAARLDDGECFQVRTAVLVHTCPIETRAQFQRQPSTSVISDMMRSRYVGFGRGPAPTEVMRSLQAEHNINVSYWKAWRARELAVDSAKGSAAGSYALLPTYLHLVKKSNTGSVTDLVTETDGLGENRFKYCFVAMGASVRGWKFMRKVLVIDGAHLRGRYAGCLITASAQDGNFQIFPIAYAIVDGENDRAWEWFFSVLKRIIPDDEELTFVSDRHSSIYAGLSKVYPRASHGACIVHLQRNVASKFKIKALASLIGKASRAYRKQTFEEHFAEIEKLCRPCAEYLTGIGFHHWTRSHCFGDRYNIMTSNVAESLNAVLKEARELPIVSTLEYIRGTIMTWFTKRRDKASTHQPPLTPKVMEIIQVNYERATAYNVLKINTLNYEVKTTTGLSYHVDLQKLTCTCEEFSLLKIPCSHAVAAALKAEAKIQDLAATEYGTFFWNMAYSGSIYPVPDAGTLYEIPDEIAMLNVLPPITRRPPGRPKRVRYLSTGEFKRPRKVGKRQCTRCHGLGHNRATCKMPI